MNKSNISNKKIIGIPRAISYYNNYPFYYSFFTALGINIVLSDKTTTKIINNGSKTVVSETCLPIKVYVGHVLNLLEKGCDKIFIPSIQSSAYKINNCSKIRGLPEIIRNVINVPFTMVEPTLDKTENIGLKDFCYEIASYFDILDKNVVDTAIQKAWKTYNRFVSLTKSGISYKEAFSCAIENRLSNEKSKPLFPIKVAVMAHGYNLFDERISLNLIKKLEKMNVSVLSSINVTREESLRAIESIGEVQYWSNELELTGVAAHYLKDKSVDGIIALSAFGCGPDSLMVDEISYHCEKIGMPLMHLTIDEHTGEAGFVTRLEAFVDMLTRKRMRNNKKYKTISNSVQKQILEDKKLVGASI